MARTSHQNAMAGASQNGSSHAKPGVWIQYKGPRARALQTTRTTARTASLKASLSDEFRADLEALLVTVPGVPMDDIRIVWGTGQIRATYGIRGNEFRQIVKYLIGRAQKHHSATLVDRSIARVWYVEDGSPLTLEASMSSAPPGHRLSYDSPRLSLSHSTGSLSAVAMSGAQSLNNTQPPITNTDRADSRDRPPAENARALHQKDHPLSHAPILPYPTPTVSQHPPAPQILPPIYLNRENAHGGHGTTQMTRLGPPVSHPETTLKLPENMLQTLARTRHLPPIPAVRLTPGTCQRLCNRSDNDILSSSPVVRILVLRDPDGSYGKAYEAFITDGSDYAWLVFSPSLNARIGDRDARQQQLRVGSVAKLMKISRLPLAASSIGLVHDFEVVECESDARSGLQDSPISAQPRHEHASDVVSEGGRPFHLSTEKKLQEERQRCKLLEGLLADVCRDLHGRNILAPAAFKALKMIEELADVAMSID